MNKSVESAALRALRTFLQTFLAVIIAAPAFHAAGSGTVDWSALKTVVFGAAAAGCVALVTLIYNMVENWKGIEIIPKG